MSIRNRWLAWLLGIVTSALLLIVAGCFGLYALGARQTPDQLIASNYHAPASIRAQYLAVEANGAQTMPKLNPLTVWIYVYHDVKRDDRSYRALQLPIRAARMIIMRDKTPSRAIQHHLAEFSAVIKISRQWTLEQTISTILAESYFGRDVFGVEAAAQLYFGVSAAELRPQESLALVSMLRGPQIFDPLCRRERFDQRYASLAEKLGKTGPDWSASAALARLRPMTCERH